MTRSDKAAMALVVCGVLAMVLVLVRLANASPVQITSSVAGAVTSTVLAVDAFEVTCATDTPTHITDGDGVNEVLIKLDKDETGYVWFGGSTTATAAAGFWLGPDEPMRFRGRGLYCLSDGATPIDIRVLGGD